MGQETGGEVNNVISALREHISSLQLDYCNLIRTLNPSVLTIPQQSNLPYWWWFPWLEGNQ